MIPGKCLPIDSYLPAVKQHLQTKNRLIIQAPPGAGKSTRVPLALDGKIIVLQPRRVAARTVAKRMAETLGEKIGETVGYHIRHDRKVSRKTRILVITEGLLTRYLVSDPFLEQTDVIILDEFHERSIHADLAMAFIRTIQEAREDLKLVVMSATLNVESLSNYLGHPPLVNVPIRMFPLTKAYYPRSLHQPIEESMLQALRTALKDQETGDILAFLSGAADIRRAVSLVKKSALNITALPFFSGLPPQEQELVFKKCTKRRVIFSTNIAETSLTIPGISAVIDSGWCKQSHFESSTGLSGLKEVRISKASAEQRAGRAGRLSAGIVLRLWSHEDQAARREFDQPEIMRTDLSGPILSILNHHGPDLSTFPFYERPPDTLLKNAVELLHLLGAVDHQARVTDFGKQLLQLPIEPRKGAILVSAGNDPHTACLLCALLDTGSIIQGREKKVGLLDQLHLLELNTARSPADQWSQQYSLHGGSIRRAVETYRQLFQQAKKLHQTSAHREIEYKDVSSLLPMLLAGFPDRLCVLNDDGTQGVMANGRQVRFLNPEKGKEYALALQIESSSNRRHAEPLIVQSIGFNWGALQKYAGSKIKKTKQSWYDEDKEKTVCREIWKVGSRLTVRKGAYLKGDPQESARILSEKVLSSFSAYFKPSKEALSIMWRIRFAFKYMSDQSWPDVSTEGIKAMVPHVCRTIANSEGASMEDFRKFKWASYWLSQLDWKARTMLDSEAPETILTPCGKKAHIQYENEFGVEGRPILSGILQHFFGLKTVPLLGKGQVKPLIHILGPNRRPVQVTLDLAGFWTGSYLQIRKELKGRYPKHHWPENP